MHQEFKNRPIPEIIENLKDDIYEMLDHGI